MARRMKVEGSDKLADMLNQLSNSAQFVAAMALYDGAGVVADAVTEETKNISTEKFNYAAVEGRTTRLPSPEEKALLLDGAAGIAKFEKNGSIVETSVGFNNSGYGMIKGKRKPIPQIANAINSGTSFMKKQPFFRKAVNRAKDAAVAKMEATGEATLKEIMEK